MPVKNTASFLNACVDSILSQTYPHWELIAIDDHSTDSSFSILKEYEEKDHRIKVLKNKGDAIIPALQLAFKNSNGQLITRMDSDDIMSSNKLEELSHILIEKGEGSLAVGLVEYFSDSSLGEGYKKYADWLNNLSYKEIHFTEIYKECVIPSPCWMIWKKDLERCEAFDPDIYPEDYDLCFRFYKEKLNILPVLKTLHLWRDHGNRTSRNDPKYLDNQFTSFKVQKFLEIDYHSSSNLVLWGAGKKGKNIAKEFIRHHIPFKWICDNKNKIGKDIYGIILEDYNSLPFLPHQQIIISVSSPKDIKEIQQWLTENNISNYYFFS